MHIILDAHSEVQNDITLKPEKWMWKNQNDAKEKVKSSLHKPNEEFRKGRDEFIELCITLVHQQHAHGNKDHIDSIVDMEKLAASEKKCEECGCEADISHRTCRNCGGKVSRIALNNIYVSGGGEIGPYDSFDRIKNKSRDINCVVGEPDFVNPNSFATITEVLQNIGHRAGIKHYGGGKREWLFVECDGLPYSIIRDLLDNLWQCTFCKDCFYM